MCKLSHFTSFFLFDHAKVQFFKIMMYINKIYIFTLIFYVCKVTKIKFKKNIKSVCHDLL